MIIKSVSTEIKEEYKATVVYVYFKRIVYQFIKHGENYPFPLLYPHHPPPNNQKIPPIYARYILFPYSNIFDNLKSREEI
jgi:hypothetical protein